MSDTISPRNFSRYPLLWLSACLVGGIIIGYFFEARAGALLIPIALLAAACLVWESAAGHMMPVIFIFVGVICYETSVERVAADRLKRLYDQERIQSGEPVEIEGVLRGLPETGAGGVFLLLRSEKLTFRASALDVSGNVRLFLPVENESAAKDLDRLDLRYGSRIRIYCKLEREERFQNPGVASHVAMLDQQGIDATATIKSPLLIEKLGDDSIFLPLAWIYEQRQRLIVEFRERFEPQTAGVMIASLLGNQHFLDRRTSDIFRDGGTFHVLVISGLHITFIGELTLWFVSYFFRRRSFQFILAATFLWAYTLAVGAEVPVVRASIMFTILLFSRVVYRETSQLNSLGLCILLLLVWRPGDLFSASFQLTVVSVAAIVGCAFPLIEKLRAIGSWMPSSERPLPPGTSKWLKYFCEFLYWNDLVWKIETSRQIWSANLFKSVLSVRTGALYARGLIGYVFEGVLVSLIVQIWMLPLLVIYFHRVSLVSLLLNLWVGFFLAVESFCALFAILIGYASQWLARPLIELTELSNAMMIWIPALLSDHRLASFRVPTYPGSAKLIYFLFVAAVLIAAASMFRWNPFSLGRRRPVQVSTMTAAFVGATTLGLVIVLHPLSAPNATGELSIDFLDVGQGDSALVTFADGVTMLIDGGGQMDYRSDDQPFEPDRRRIGETVVSEFLWEKGYSHIDYLVATHADADHIQGLSDVAANFGIGSILIGTVSNADPDFAELMRVAESRNIPVATIGRGSELDIGGAKVRVLNPPDNLPSSTSPNNSSVVMKIIYGSRVFLMTGDIERQIETELIKGSAEGLRADVIKVAHHGSRTSSTLSFVDRVVAKLAVISVGRKSRFGHPHAEVVTRWMESGAQVLKTGEKGTITVTTNGDGIRTSTFVP
jgi:competence protein ComEC